MDSSVPLRHDDPRDIGLISLVKKRKIHFRIVSDLKIQSWIFLKKRTHFLQTSVYADAVCKAKIDVENLFARKPNNPTPTEKPLRNSFVHTKILKSIGTFHNTGLCPSPSSDSSMKLNAIETRNLTSGEARPGQVDGPVHGLSAGGLLGASCQKQGVWEGVLYIHLP